MSSALRPSALVLFVGDLLFFALALWVTLALRSLSIPSDLVLWTRLVAFVPLFFAWTLVFFVAGLYEGRRIFFARRELSATLLYAQFVNIVLAALFFFALPLFGIAPKTVLVIYFIVSSALIYTWRTAVFPRMGFSRRAATIVIGSGAEVEELTQVLRTAPLSTVSVAAVLDPATSGLAAALKEAIAAKNPDFIIADFRNSLVTDAFPELYALLARHIRFIDAKDLYEEVFARIPLSLVNQAWIARHISYYVHILYDILKRALDIVVALAAAIVSLVFYPFIVFAIFLESGNPIFIGQDRVGEGNRIIHLYKFRTMTGNDNGNYANGTSSLHVTKVGAFLRMTRLDELPQLWNVLNGDLSLIGPRPELPILVAHYEEQIPYYGVRHLIKPGLSGWAQLYHDNHPHHGADVEATREKLSYDLYYLKHRSIALDAVVALKTIAKLLTRSGV